MDVSRPTLFVAALIAGFLVGLATTPSYAEATHQNLYQVTMAPPTHPTGSEAYNSCGWHSGACVYPVPTDRRWTGVITTARHMIRTCASGAGFTAAAPAK